MPSSKIIGLVRYSEIDSLDAFITTLASHEPDGLFSQTSKSLFSPKLKSLLAKYPLLRDELLAEFERFFILSSEEFRKIRSTKSLIRLVFSYHFLRKKIYREIRIFPQQRHLFTRIFSSQLSFPFGKKNVLGIAMAVHLPDRYDFFDEHHIYLAVQELSPSFQFVPGSFCSVQTGQDKLRFLYIEVEKSNGKNFQLQEYKLLKTQTTQRLKERIEKVSPSLFMMPNREELMKNLLILGQELRFSTDIPQICISLEKQTLQHLFFTVIVVRIIKNENFPLTKLFKVDSEIKITLDHEQIIGYVSDGNPKKGSICQLQIPRSRFLRSDSSTNFYAARNKVVSLLGDALGKIRDYNGGMLLKQGEALSQLQEKVSIHYAELIEDLFYSITPIEMQVTLPITILHDFLQTALDILGEKFSTGEHYLYRTQQRDEWSFIIIYADDASLKNILEERVRGNSSMSFFSRLVKEKLLMGCLCVSAIPEIHSTFFASIQQGIEHWKKKKSLSIIRLYYQNWPYSLDPRLGGDLHSTILLKALFDGLTRRGKDGQPVLSVAERVTISEDQKQYIFHLRKSLWSNGDFVTAFDFEYAWKKILSPDFNFSFAYLFYPIKKAEAIKRGELALSCLGVHSLDDFTLSIELEQPCSYFLELLSHAIYSPVNHKIDQQYPYWFTFEGSSYICNGPFYLLKSDAELGRYELVKNLRYWDAAEVQLEKILLLKADVKTAYEMFNNDEIDWLGRPVSHWDISFSVFNNIAQKSNAYSVYWYIFNVQSYPFHNKNFRKAIAHTIDRKQLVALYPQMGFPTMAPLPLSQTQYRHLQIPDCSSEQANKYLEKALKELRIDRQQLPAIILSCSNGETRYRMALLVKQQIEQTLQLKCHIQIYPWEKLFAKMTQGDYQLGSLSWSSLINDPCYTLNAFKYAHQGINFAKWEHFYYQQLLNAMAKEEDPIKRQKYVAQCEALLMEEVPIIPIYYESQLFLKKSHILLPEHLEAKDLDFKWVRTLPRN